jgi:glycosyltransferase involved in cell wall biosynthesis
VKIALDATYSIGENLSGVGVYSREILFGAAEAHPEARFEFCYRPHRYLRAWRESLPRNARRRLLAEALGPRAADVFHGLNQRLPHMRLRRSVVTFHDLFVMTGEYSSPEFRQRFTEQARDAAARADLIIAVSAFTKSQVVDLLNEPERKVRVVHHGVRGVINPADPLPNRKKIVLNVGAIQKRKNVGRLVHAFEALPTDWRLALAGSFGYGSEEIRTAIESSPARDRISVLGYVPADELARLYARASIFAFPSLDEGFGMPVLEAMAAGVPVLASNRSAMPEVAGTAAVTVDPEDEGGLAEALKTMAEDENLRRRLTVDGFARAAMFTWERAVRKTWAAYLELLD